MKKLLVLLLTMMLCFSLTACGGSEDSDVSGGDKDNTVADDNGDANVEDEYYQQVADAYAQVEALYEQVSAAAEENGWTADEQTAAELEAVVKVLNQVGPGIEDASAFADVDMQALAESMNNLVTALGEMVDRVSVPYEG